MAYPNPAYDAALTAAVFFDLSGRGVIDLAGPEARFFLHNLCTNDVKNLRVGGGCEAFLCTPKAKVIAHVLVGHYQEKEAGVLRLDFVPGMNDVVFQHLNRHLISEQVELADRTADLAIVRVAGPRSLDILAEILGKPVPPPAAYHNVQAPWPGGDAGPVRTMPDMGIPAYDCWLPRAQSAAWTQRLVQVGAVAGSADVLETLRLEAGTPVYGRDIDAERFVVEVHRPGAISYSKGCYLGQEPIVMARDRGQVNRLLLGVVAEEGEEPLSPGSKLFAGDTEVGQVTSSTWSPRLGKVIALAYLRRGHQEAGMMLMANSPVGGGRAVKVTALPFV